ncbi:MAG: glycosyltransferase [Gemmatimonadaceae bacterium]
MSIALVHDYFYQAGGAERVVEVLHRMFPTAPIYTTIAHPERMWPGLQDADFRPSWMQRLPGMGRWFRAYLPLYPRAIESLDLRAYDLVISSSSAFAKSAIVRSDACHVCYCHTPMRFAWDYERYIAREQFGRLARIALPPLVQRLRRWDRRTAERVSTYIANSGTVRDRIRRCYGRDAEIVFPPVALDRFAAVDEDADYYLIVSRMSPYKRLDIAVEAFTRMGRELLVIGDGPGRAMLERMAGPTIRFAGTLSDAEVARHYARCRGLIFPGEEDFGIAPLEANAAGRPVVAYAAGGALDTVVDGRTGVLFYQQTASALCWAVEQCDAAAWDKKALRRHSEQFSEGPFRERMASVIERSLDAGALPEALSALTGAAP